MAASTPRNAKAAPSGCEDFSGLIAAAFWMDVTVVIV
jgi:hypothetical protein